MVNLNGTLEDYVGRINAIFKHSSAVRPDALNNARRLWRKIGRMQPVAWRFLSRAARKNLTMPKEIKK